MRRAVWHREFWRPAAAGLAVALYTFALGVPPAAAQSFFDMLFGGGAKPAAQAPAANGYLTPGGRPYAFPSSPVSPRRSTDRDDDESDRGGKYRTVCVRMCDGYYFPISTSTTRKGFYRDQMRCRASCGDEGRLFHVPASQTTIDEATDDDGRIYAGLKMAFIYRKKRIEGCLCRPEPWSVAEVDRHRAYADAAEAEKARQQPADDRVTIAGLPPAPMPNAAKSTDAATPAPQVGSDAASEQASPATTVSAAAPPAKPERAARSPKSQQAVAKVAPNYGPSPVKIPPSATLQAGAKPQPPLAGGMALGGGGLVWPGDAPPPAVKPRR